MSDQIMMVIAVIAASVVIGVICLGGLALLLGRPVRAHGRAKLGEKSEFSVGVDVPGVQPARLARAPRQRPERQ